MFLYVGILIVILLAEHLLILVKMMKKQSIISAGMIAILALVVAQTASATIINDDYWGGNDHGRGDVIGKKAWFEIKSMDVELTGNSLSVTVNTNFAGRGDDGLYSGGRMPDLTMGKGIGYGDLFLSSAWTPNTDAPHYASDNSSNGTEWSYAFSLGEQRWATEGGSGSLYSLVADGTDSDTLLSEDFLNRGIFRNGQEIAVITEDKEAISSGSWSILDDTNDTVGKINFLIDISGTRLAGSSTIALHWGMTCGNDTIEGEYSVPEPAILGLLALGLIGIGVSQRKRY